MFPPTTKHPRSLLMLFAAATLVAGSASASSILLPEPPEQAETDVSPRYTVAEFAIAAVGKDVKTRILGNPFDAPKEKLDAAVIEHMQLGNWDYPRDIRPDTTLGRKIKFSQEPTGVSRDDYDLAIFFNLNEDVPVESLCQRDGNLPAYGDGPQKINVAFCRESTVIGASHMSLADISGLEDEDFERKIVAAMRAVFPQQMFRDFQRSTIRPHMR